jgi:RNA polymerase III subunit Rpc25
MSSSSSHSIADEQTFAWHPPDAPEESVFYFDVGELVRFRVESEEWHDHAPTGPTQSEKAKERIQQLQELRRANGQLDATGRQVTGETTGEIERRAPYVVIVSLKLVSPLYCFPSFRSIVSVRFLAWHERRWLTL